MQKITLKNFFIPRSFDTRSKKGHVFVCAIIPTYKPNPRLTVQLVRDLLSYNTHINVYVVDDCTPSEYEERYHVFETIRGLSKRVRVLRTPKNKLKAGAINYGLEYIDSLTTRKPDAVLTLDDDVVIEKETVRELVKGLLADSRIGAVCSQCRVLNKNANLLTRLQGLEYLGFNATRLGDEGFINGPLVMHGMLTLFRYEVFMKSGHFAEHHLIEDYEMTARIKRHGWHVRLVPSAHAWTEVPETFPQLWKQRARWTYGGLKIMRFCHPVAVFQDIIGHGMFLLMFVLIIISLFIHSSLNDSHGISRFIPMFVIAISIIQVFVWYVFQIWYMRFYAEKDYIDWIVRLTLVPEFIYANILSLVLLGSYLFMLFSSRVVQHLIKVPGLTFVIIKVKNAFAKLGYHDAWGTR